MIKSKWNLRAKDWFTSPKWKLQPFPDNTDFLSLIKLYNASFYMTCNTCLGTMNGNLQI